MDSTPVRIGDKHFAKIYQTLKPTKLPQKYGGDRLVWYETTN